MSELKFSIQPYKVVFREQILEVWETSVLATHHFLKAKDFEIIKEIVSSIDFEEFSVFCLVGGRDQVLGFMGLLERKLEMLFLDPRWIGKGLGRVLLDYAIDSCGCIEVDVNEQNVPARIFYEKAGFEVIDRSEKDSAGMDYPILHMRLKPNP
ncbi:GNAT family N-acetyltransferase [Algoriphagus sp.]|uniref:GNAT family N-acetyltransferase n=1 Tax=Algoriphagus sp. TaxID=1872435 RepID=UPI003919499F